jgi:hypothetical protein
VGTCLLLKLNKTFHEYCTEYSVVVYNILVPKVWVHQYSYLADGRKCGHSLYHIRYE